MTSQEKAQINAFHRQIADTRERTDNLATVIDSLLLSSPLIGSDTLANLPPANPDNPLDDSEEQAA